jgi:serine kinase of HPr protein (carbohydrate metabolism regulator)
MSARHNIHATAIVLGTKGYLLTGPSGVGKSTLALALLSGAMNRGLYAALVGDDQVFVSKENGRIIAQGPASIAGLIEVRGTGILSVPHVYEAVIDTVIQPIATVYERLPLPDETFMIEGIGVLPLVKIPLYFTDPLPVLMQYLSHIVEI